MLGDPIHRRTIEVGVGAARDGRRELRARIIDRRLQGFTTTGGQTLGPGPVHDMSARLVLDVEQGRLAEVEGAMALPAFAGSTATRFESCRDILPNLGDLGGAAVDASLTRSVRDAFGRERGCYHLLSLVHAAVPVLRGVLRRRPPDDATPRRTLELLVTELDEPRVRMHGLLVEQWAAAEAPRRARLAFALAPTGVATTADGEPGPGMRMREVLAQAAPELLADPEVEQRLEGMPLLAGFAPAVLERLGDAPARAELLALALALSAVVTQAFVIAPRPPPGSPEARPNRAIGTCYMWRSGGPLELGPTAVGRTAASGS